MPQSGAAVTRGNRGRNDEQRTASRDRSGREPRPRTEGSQPEAGDGPRRGTSDPLRGGPLRGDLVRGGSGDGYAGTGGVPGRRTVTIHGRGAERYVPRRSASSRRRPERRYERSGFRPDRAAMWAVLLSVLLILVAAMSAHASVLAHIH